MPLLIFFRHRLTCHRLRASSRAKTAREERESKDDAPFAALAFKIARDPNVAKIVYCRIYSGTLKRGEVLYNVTKDTSERATRILQMHANKRKPLMKPTQGTLSRLLGLKNTTTGDTLTTDSHPILLESMVFPEPVISVAIEPRSERDKDALEETLDFMMEEDPTFTVQIDDETGQSV